MRICTWNVNSIKARKELILEWLKHRNHDIDVLCFQEIKTIEKDVFFGKATSGTFAGVTYSALRHLLPGGF